LIHRILNFARKPLHWGRNRAPNSANGSTANCTEDKISGGSFANFLIFNLRTDSDVSRYALADLLDTLFKSANPASSNCATGCGPAPNTVEQIIVSAGNQFASYVTSKRGDHSLQHSCGLTCPGCHD
jgi:hypothetical protein